MAISKIWGYKEDGMVQERRSLFIASLDFDLRIYGLSERLHFISKPCCIFEERSTMISSPDIPPIDTHFDENTGPEFLKVRHIFAAANAVALFVSLPVKWSSNAFRHIKSSSLAHRLAYYSPVHPISRTHDRT